ncbi:MAG TPA: hypothetical protein VNA69_22075 [Thermoanaerobaculia bacterium]|nr:hypothetical protein [Thermoanaerobaculia bacterium]
MRTIGIIGGIGPESTIDYYRLLIDAYRSRVLDGSYPSIVINSIDVGKVLVVPGDDDDRYSGVREPLERLEDAQDEPGLHLAPEEDVAAVDDEVHLAPKRRLQGAFEAREEVLTPPGAVGARTHWKVEPEMRVRDQQETDGSGHDKSVERATIVRLTTCRVPRPADARRSRRSTRRRLARDSVCLVV